MNGRYILGIWGKHKYSEISSTSKRAFFGSFSRTKMEGDVALAKLSPYTPKNITVYCFGEDNFKYLVDQGFECKLIEKQPYIWNMETEWWRHKIEVIKCGLNDGVPAVYLDWDCIAVKKIPDNMWDLLSQKSFIQTHLKIYKQLKAYWRPVNKRFVVEGCFMYFGKNVADDIIKVWDKSADKYLDETVVARYIDEINGGWKGEVDYCNQYEPYFQVPGAHRFHSPNRDPYIFFRHIKFDHVKGVLELLKSGKKWVEIFA